MGNREMWATLMASAAVCAVAPATPAAAQTRTFDVPAQSAATGVPEFARQADIQILVSESAVQGARTQAVKGRLPVEQALERLIAGTGLRIASGDGRSYTLAREPLVQPSDQETQGASSLGEIVVTAQRRSERLQDVPVSVTVATGAMLERNNIGSLSDLSARLPNVRIASAPGANLLSIRGVGSGLNVGFEQAVGTFVDGVYRGRSRATAAALFDVEQVEVLKGPQTTFFGNNVIAGALNVGTRKPGTTTSINATALYAPGDGEYNLEAGLSAPLTSSAGIRIAGRLFGMDGFGRNATLDKDAPHKRDAVGRVSLFFEPNQHFRSDIRVDAVRLRDKGAPFLEGANCPPNPIYGPPRGTCLRYIQSGQPVDGRLDQVNAGFESSTRYDMAEVAATNKLEFDNMSLTSITSYFRHKSNIISNVAPFPLLGVGGTASPNIVNDKEDVDQYTQELRLMSTGDGPVQFMVGGYYAVENLDSLVYAALYQGPFGAFAAPTYNAATPIASRVIADQRAETLSAFASLDAALTSSFKIGVGIRYSRVKKEIERDLNYGVGGAVPGPSAFTPGSATVQVPLVQALGGALGNFADPTRTDDKLMPSIKVQYQFQPDIMGYLSFTKGFKAGGYGFASGKFDFDPETVDAYEAGIKASLFQRRLFASFAVYRSDYVDLQESTFTVLASGIIQPVVTNAAGARAQGAELGINVRLGPQLTLNTDLAYLDSKYRSYPNAPCTVLGNLTPGCVQNMSGKRRAYAPKFSGNVGLSFTQPVTDAIDLRVEPLVYFSSKYFQSATADPLLSQGGYVKVDLRLGLGPVDRRWEVALIGKNLTDKTTASFRNQFAGSPGSIWANTEPPRSIALQASAKF